MLGRTFLEFTRAGRKTGQPHDTVAMILHYDDDPGSGSSAPRGIRTPTGPATCVQPRRGPSGPGATGTRRSTGFLSAGEALDVAAAFRREHRHRLHLLQFVLG